MWKRRVALFDNELAEVRRNVERQIDRMVDEALARLDHKTLVEEEWHEARIAEREYARG